MIWIFYKNPLAYLNCIDKLEDSWELQCDTDGFSFIPLVYNGTGINHLKDPINYTPSKEKENMRMPRVKANNITSISRNLRDPQGLLEFIEYARNEVIQREPLKRLDAVAKDRYDRFGHIINGSYTIESGPAIKNILELQSFRLFAWVRDREEGERLFDHNLEEQRPDYISLHCGVKHLNSEHKVIKSQHFTGKPTRVYKKYLEWATSLGDLGSPIDIQGRVQKLGDDISSNMKASSVTVEVSTDPLDILRCSDNTTGWSSCFRPHGEYASACFQFAMSPDVFVVSIYTSDGRLRTRRLAAVDKSNNIYVFRNYGDKVGLVPLFQQLTMKLRNCSEDDVMVCRFEDEFESGGNIYLNWEDKRPDWVDNVIMSFGVGSKADPEEHSIRGYTLNPSKLRGITYDSTLHITTEQHPQSSKWVVSNKLYDKFLKEHEVDISELF